MAEYKELTRDNIRLLLAAFMENSELSARHIAKLIGSSEKTIERILAGITWPSDEMIKQVGTMLEIGFERYAMLSNAKKQIISEKIGVIGGGTLGFASISATVSTLGFAGLSAAGTVSGLTTLGSIVGGGLVAGVGVSAAIPIAAGTLGYGIIKSINAFVKKRTIDKTEIDGRWEIILNSMNSKNSKNKE